VKAGIFCIVEPPETALPDEREQLSGLVAVTSLKSIGGNWCMSPPARVCFSKPTRFTSGRPCEARATVEVAIPESWLRPIKGPSIERDLARIDEALTKLERVLDQLAPAAVGGRVR
jgi:hypothetical protein